MNLQGRTLDIYEIGDELGRGGMGVVYRAATREDSLAGPAGTAVAVKVFHPQLVADTGAVERFRREAEIGRSLHSPNVVRTYDAAVRTVGDQPCHYMVMELIEGQTLGDLRRELGTLPDHLLFHVADQALHGLSAIHALGVVHRDLKPENIVITTRHEVLLMDLGVARVVEQGHTLTQHGDFVGSLVYAAPEQFDGSAPIAPASDVYAFGVVLWELSTGEVPFDAKDLPGLLRRKLREVMPRPKDAHPDLDAFWDEVIATCTARHPDDRFASAEALREILAQGRGGEWWRARIATRARPVAERALSRLRTPREAPLVGRHAELEALRAAAAAAATGEGRVALVGGAAGSGKSRLVYELALELAEAGGLAVRTGRAAGPGGRAFQPFLEVLDDLLAIEETPPADRPDAVRRKLAALLPDTPGVVGPLTDFLLAGVRGDGAGGLDKDVLMSAIANVLRRAAAESPQAIVIEDLHLAEPETLDLFAYLARGVAGHPLLLVGAYNDEEIPEGSALSALVTRIVERDGAVPIMLAPLSPAACDELVRALVGIGADDTHAATTAEGPFHAPTGFETTVRALGGVLRRQGDGNPFVIAEMIAHLRERGDLATRAGRLSLSTPIDTIDLPSKVTDLFAMKLAAIDDEERETLQAAAVLGYRFEADWLATVLEERRIKLLKRLAVLERKHRLIRSSGRDSFRFAKRSIRDALYQELPESLREEYHSMAADAIVERTGAGDDPASAPAAIAHQICEHLLRADRAGEVAPWAVAAASHATSNHDAAHAARFVEQLVEAVERGDERTRFALARRQWDVYEALGRRDDQVIVLERALVLAESLGDAALSAQVHCLLGVTGWRTGRNEEAASEARLARDLARQTGDREWEANALQTLGAVVRLRGDHATCAEHWREALEIRREIGDRAGEARSLASLGAVMPEIGEREGALDAKRRALEIFRELGHRRGQCAMLNNVGKTLVDEGRPGEAEEYLRTAVEMASELGDLVAEAYPLYNLGRCHAWAGRASAAKESLGRALALFREAGVPGGQIETYDELASALDDFGDLAGATGMVREGLALAMSIGARAAAGRFRMRLGDLLFRLGNDGEGREELDRAIGIARELGITRPRFDALLVRGRAELDAGRPEEALGCLEAAARAAEEGPVGDGDRRLLAVRIARAHQASGRIEEARAALADLEVPADGALTERVAVEVAFSLATVLGPDDPRRAAALELARALVRAHANRLDDPEVRAAYLERTWPASAIGNMEEG